VLRMFVQAWRDHRNATHERFKASGIPVALVDERAALTCIFNFAVLANPRLPVGDETVLPDTDPATWILEGHKAILQAGQIEHASVGVSFIPSNPAALPVVKPSQGYPILSTRLQTMDLYSRTKSFSFELERPVDYQRLFDKLGPDPEATNSEKDELALCSPNEFAEFNRLMRRNCRSAIAWERVDAVLADLDMERRLLAQTSGGAW